jgi:peptidoglycan/xylan/chitin deacetylase (PgdA/CDA1 family)
VGLTVRRLAALTVVAVAGGSLASCSAVSVPLRSGGTAGSSTASASPQTTTTGVTSRGDGGGRESRPPPALSVLVDGVAVAATDGMTVAEALIVAGVRPRNGRLVSAGTHRVLRRDEVPAAYRVDGAVGRLNTPLTPGARVTMTAGPDRVESTVVSRHQIAADPTGAHLYVGGAAGLAESRVGSISGEVVSTRILRAPVLGRLRHPGSVLLTFDDGPDLTFTPEVLQILAANHVHAVFCMIGAQARAHPGMVRRVLAGGHTLCDHTQDHDEQLAARSAHRIHTDIAQGAASILQASGGIHTRFFRAPGGNWSDPMEAEARAQHMTPLKWTVDPRDWARPGRRQITAAVLSQLRPGGVILMHDGGGNRSQTVDALGPLIKVLTKAGYSFA